MLFVIYRQAEDQTDKSENAFLLIIRKKKSDCYFSQSGPLADFDEINQLKLTVIKDWGLICVTKG